MSNLIWVLAIAVLTVFAADFLAYLVIRRPGAARPCTHCRHLVEGPTGFMLCARAAHSETSWDPVSGKTVTLQKQVSCETERAGGLVDALARALVFRRKPACSRYGFGFERADK